MNASAETVGEAVKEKASTKSKKAHASDDMLIQIVQEIAALGAEGAIEAIPGLLNNADENYFRLGGVLSAINTNEFFKKAGFETFKEFVETQYNIPYRRAMYWIQIYDTMVASGVPWHKVQPVGWTKLKDLAAIITPENVDEWVERALGMTVLQLQEAIKKHKAGTLPSSGEEQPVEGQSELTTFTTKVFAHQKQAIKDAIAKASTEAKTTFDGTALEAICMNYLSGGFVNKPVSLKATLEKYSPEEVLKAIEEAFPQFDISAKLKKQTAAA